MVDGSSVSENQVNFSGDYERFIDEEFRSTVNSYRARPDNVRENAGQEDAIIQGGYSRRQVQELVQNAADVVREGGSRIHVVATDTALYVANDGRPFESTGIKTLLHSNMSTKRDEQIGRFGLGFKSVLEITSRPQIFSTTVSFGFDAARSRDVLSPICPGLARYPVLRLPFLLDSATALADDPVLRELCSWAKTVVKLPFDRPLPWVSSSVRDFRPEFLLFSPAVASLALEVRGNGETKTVWTSERMNGRDSGVETVRLASAESSSNWVVSSGTHIPSAEASREAGDLHSRRSMKVSWAHKLGTGNSRDRGEVWSYFATGTQTTLPGIINASFNMNDDRVTLIKDIYNEEILKRTVPELVVRALPSLYRESDPGMHLNALPARGREDDPWFRENLIEPVTRIAASAAIVPGLDGRLRRISELKVRPKDVDDEQDVIERWVRTASECNVVDWVHESALQTSFRSPAIDRLLNDSPDPFGTRARATVSEWVEGLIVSDDMSSYGRTIVFAAEFVRRTTDHASAVRDSRIVPMQDGTVRTLSDGLYLPLEDDQIDPSLVNAQLLNQDVVLALKTFGVRSLDDSARLSALLRDSIENPDQPEIALSFWRAAERSPKGDVLDLLKNEDEKREIPVRTASGSWKPLNQVWAAGELLDSTNADDAKLVVDSDMPFIGRGNLRELEIPTSLPEQEVLQARHANRMWREAIQNDARQDSFEEAGSALTTTVGFDRDAVTSTPRLYELKDASFKARAKATEALLLRPQKKVKLPATESFSGAGIGVQTRRVDKQVLGPDAMWIRDHGVVRTAHDRVPLQNATAPVTGIPNDLLPVPLAFERLREIGVLGDLAVTSGTTWNSIFTVSARSLPIDKLHELYARAAIAGAPKPATLLVGSPSGSNVIELKRNFCVVAANEESLNHLRADTSKAVLSSGDFAMDSELARIWGLELIDIAFTRTVDWVASGQDDANKRVRDIFPMLRRIDGKAGRLGTYDLVPCSTIVERTENDFDEVTESNPLTFAVLGPEQGKKVLYRSTLRKKKLLECIIEFSGSKNDVDDVLDRMAAAEKTAQFDNLWEKLKRLESDEARVTELIGEEGLKDLVPNSALELLKEEGVNVTSSLLYRLAQNLHGTDLWKAIRNKIPEEGTAREWANSVKASDLSELGFAEDMQPRTERQKPRTEEVLGPIRLPELHSYQRATKEAVVRLLSAPAGKNKGIVQLPTGAGKTRVAVESLAEYLASISHEERLIVWIAQSDELCEQAVEAWTSGWGSFGIPGERLTVSRMWGGRTADEVTAGVHVVVSTFQTMFRRARDAKDSAARARYQWLEDPAVVVIDEAHGAVTTAYTEILKWFKRSTGQRGKSLLGLSATPFRGRSIEGMKALVNRFNSNLIEPEAFFTASTAHEYLQGIEVLARVNHKELEGTVLRRLHAPLSSADTGASSEDAGMDRGRQMLEERIDLESVAGDNDRNRRIVRHVVEHSDEIEHAIVFDASVDHAKALAAVLDAKGIPSAAIHGGTPAPVRRSLIHRFKDGEIRILTNFDVLSQGFDAPKVDAVYLCRPTFSPNKYLQMIGRGLRGPKNGGSAEVLVVNVKDNIEQFGDSLAYTEFAYLWRGVDV